MTAHLKREQEDPLHSSLVGRSAAMAHLRREILRVADVDFGVLIRGETGTGKELVAQAIHSYSKRSRWPFVAVNCAGMPETLAQSELFGHEPGAFTGATERRIGCFGAAHRGSLFLDELIGMAMTCQCSLLRVLHTGLFAKLGSKCTERSDARIIAATNGDLEQCIKDGVFREDLYHRLKVITIDVPPLRDRREDIPLLVKHFLRLHPIKGVTKTTAPAALDVLMAYDWPGNVRELEHLLIDASVKAETDVIESSGIPLSVAGDSPAPLRQIEPLRVSERRYIMDVVREVAGDAKLAAKHLKISTRTVHRIKAEMTAQAETSTPPIVPLDEFKIRYVAHAIRAAGGNRAKAARYLGIDRATLREWERKPRDAEADDGTH